MKKWKKCYFASNNDLFALSEKVKEPTLCSMTILFILAVVFITVQGVSAEAFGDVEKSKMVITALADAYVAYADAEIAKEHFSRAKTAIREAKNIIGQVASREQTDATQKAYTTILLKEYALNKSYLGDDDRDFEGYIEWKKNKKKAYVPTFRCRDISVRPLAFSAALPCNKY